MGSATREALASSKEALVALGAGADLATADGLFAAGRAIGGSSHLSAALSDPAADADAKRVVVDRIFGGQLGAQALGLLQTVVSARWSSEQDLLAGIEELGLRAASVSAGAQGDIEAELFEFGKLVSSNHELELALSSKLGSAEAKGALAASLLEGHASPQTVSIVGQLVQQPRGRRIGELLRYAAGIIADQQGLAVATVTAAAPIEVSQLQRLERHLATAYGRQVKINQVIDPAVVGGLRVQLGDDVIDGSLAARLNDLRLQLAR
ncbi:F0F1 ATP synthase subunit delta [Plantibacter sp. VKM Ac-2880]|uniref:F0F1 ATP synthase subunit delta n=1 Tax=Plantibacter sp. VKM Ac-2880 TaxID=2783827 RepID=UPI00188DDDE7|nr:F0F1 ATP synthase subunit delta [Plantibacter sp. VKM Ac-2880]MBF4569694.1 F0F1 ATP synthase subunit delta [Plantibacter sp. VKM Ac-2880]